MPPPTKIASDELRVPEIRRLQNLNMRSPLPENNFLMSPGRGPLIYWRTTPDRPPGLTKKPPGTVPESCDT
jgi:hypothetical protein